MSLHGTESRERLECPLGTFLDTALCSGVALLSPPVTQPGILAQGSCLVAIPSRCWLFRSCHCNVGANISIQPLLLQEPAGNASFHSKPLAPELSLLQQGSAEGSKLS